MSKTCLVQWTNVSIKILKHNVQKHPWESGKRLYNTLILRRPLNDVLTYVPRSAGHCIFSSLSLQSVIIRCLASTPTASKDAAKDESKISYDNNYITEFRAINDYLLKPGELAGLRITVRRSPFENDPPLKVYWRKDVEARAVNKWGSLENIELEKEVKESSTDLSQFPVYRQFLSEKVKERVKKYGISDSSINAEQPRHYSMRNLRTYDTSSGDTARVVGAAIAINSTNFVIKLGAWAVTGSHSMFAEAIHSAADTFNQLVLAYGIRKSNQTPNKSHPYGYSNMQYVSSLISGVGIFCMGAGLSVYHGISGLISPSMEMESIGIALAILGISFVSESVTLALAVKSIRKSAAENDMGFVEFVKYGSDPCVNVVLLEDIAAVLGVGVAASCMGFTYYSGSPTADAVGSLVIGGLLGSVASFMIHTNSAALIGRSIPDERIQEINKVLEGDIMVRQVHDVKGIDMGNGIVRYKAEIDFDGRELARSYINRSNMTQILPEVKLINCEEDMEQFLLKHGENIVDCLGHEVDRIERNLRKQHPEVRHIDLEIL